MRFLLLILVLAGWTHASPIPQSSRQLILGIAPDWNSSYVELTAYNRASNGWQPAGFTSKGRLGKSGLAWGRGLTAPPAGAKLVKREGDRRAPAGAFRIGGAFGYDPSIKKHPKLFYRQITPNDLWVEDVNSPSYNKHLVLDRPPQSKWEKKQQMRQGDYAHSLKLFVAHNAPPRVQKGAGSAIFFHIWRGGGSKATFGCTTMPEGALRRLIAWIDPTKEPVYVLLPKAEYQNLRSSWRLP